MMAQQTAAKKVTPISPLEKFKKRKLAAEGRSSTKSTIRLGTTSLGDLTGKTGWSKAHFTSLCAWNEYWRMVEGEGTVNGLMDIQNRLILGREVVRMFFRDQHLQCFAQALIVMKGAEQRYIEAYHAYGHPRANIDPEILESIKLRLSPGEAHIVEVALDLCDQAVFNIDLDQKAAVRPIAALRMTENLKVLIEYHPRANAPQKLRP